MRPTFGEALDGPGPHEMGLVFEQATGEPMEHVEADLEAYAPGEPTPWPAIVAVAALAAAAVWWRRVRSR